MIIKVIDGNGVKNFNDSIKNDSWLVWYYADWCGHCKAMENEWENLESKCDKNKRLNIAKVNDQYISQLEKNPNVRGFPTIKLYSNGNEVKDYDGERNSNSFLKFLKSNVLSQVPNMKKQKNPTRKISRKKQKPSRPKSRKHNSNNSGINTNNGNNNILKMLTNSLSQRSPNSQRIRGRGRGRGRGSGRSKGKRSRM